MAAKPFPGRNVSGVGLKCRFLGPKWPSVAFSGRRWQYPADAGPKWPGLAQH